MKKQSHSTLEPNIMKKSLHLSIVALTACLAFKTATADAQLVTGTTGDGLIYSVSDSQITITGYAGSGGKMTIPSTIDVSGSALPVTSIGDCAFADCTSLTDAAIPGSVTSIGRSAFQQCTALKNVTISNGVTSIGNDAFCYCTDLRQLTIPGSVTSIGYLSFESCRSLTSITVDVLNFYYSSLDGVLFDKTRTTLIKYPEGKIGSYAVPSSVTSIGDRAFAHCAGLTSLMIPGSVTSIEYSVALAFDGCHSLTSIVVDALNPTYSSVGGVLFDKAQTTLLRYPGGKTGGYEIPSSVARIDNFAFNSCYGSISVAIPPSVTSIGTLAFSIYSGMVLFLGNAPGTDSSFSASPLFEVHYRLGATGFTSPYWSGVRCLPTVAARGEVAAGMMGALFTTLGNPAMNEAGGVAFTGRFVGAGVDATNSQGIWADDQTGAQQLIVQSGTFAPSCGSAVFRKFSDPVYSGSNAVAFRGTLVQGTGGVTGSNDIGVWSSESGSLRLAAREGAPAPGCPTGVTFSQFKQFALTDNNGVVMLAKVAGAGVDSTNDYGIWAGSGLVLREGDPIPGTGETAKRIIFLPARSGVTGQTRGFIQSGDKLLYGVTTSSRTSAIYKAVSSGTT